MNLEDLSQVSQLLVHAATILAMGLGNYRSTNV